jgi:transposase
VIFLAYGVASWVLAALLVDWRRWRLGYRTALAAALGSSVLDLSGVGHGLCWSYRSALLPSLWPNLVLNLSLYPLGAWIFAQHLPPLGPRLWLAGLVGEGVLLAEEALLRVSGHLEYHHGWSLWASAGANAVLLTGLWLHARWAEMNK